jgi:glycosyltransferase involved in cell wall biosynthesis
VIVVFDALAWGFEHIPFNASFIASLAEAYPGEPIQFSGQRDHVAQLRRYLEPRFSGLPVEWRELDLPPRFAPPRERLTRDFRICQAIMSEARRLGASRVIACYLHAETGVLAFKTLALLYRRCLPAFVHHGSLMRLLSSRRYRPLLALGNGHLRQLVLGDSIRSEVLKEVPRLLGSVHAIRHPYFFDETGPSDLPEAGPMTFSFLGLVDETKGFPEFIELAETISTSSGEAARFDLIGGKRGGSTPGSAGRWVKTYGDDGPIPRDVFERQLALTTYAVFPYLASYYRFIASGSVLDSLAAGKPIIAFRNPQFQEMFDTMGDIGYLCDDLAEMKRTIATIMRDPPRERYRRQSQAILAGRRIFSPAAVATQLRAALALANGG